MNKTRTVVLIRGGRLSPVTYGHTCSQRAQRRALELAHRHDADVEQDSDGTWIVDAEAYYTPKQDH